MPQEKDVKTPPTKPTKGSSAVPKFKMLTASETRQRGLDGTEVITPVLSRKK